MSMRIRGDLPPRQQFVWMTAAVKWADQVGPMVRGKLKDAAPVGEGARAGRLRDSIRYERVTESENVTLTFKAHVPYAKYVVEGARPHKIYPVAARYLHFFQNIGGVPRERFVGPRGSGARSAYVEHPGNKPNPFNVRAMEEAMPDIKELFVRIMSEAMGGRS